jgi:hypothetical protein
MTGTLRPVHFNWKRWKLQQSLHPLYISLQAERMKDIQRKLAHEVVTTADPRLGQHIVGTASQYIVSRR